MRKTHWYSKNKEEQWLLTVETQNSNDCSVFNRKFFNFMFWKDKHFESIFPKYICKIAYHSPLVTASMRLRALCFMVTQLCAETFSHKKTGKVFCKSQCGSTSPVWIPDVFGNDRNSKIRNRSFLLIQHCSKWFQIVHKVYDIHDHRSVPLLYIFLNLWLCYQLPKPCLTVADMHCPNFFLDD